MNKERNFWVYRHPQFHRDRPEFLHLLRRRTCPGVDGRKNRPQFDISSLEKGAAGGKKTKKATATKKKSPKSPSSSTDAVEVTPTPKKKRSSKTTSSSVLGATKKARLFVSASAATFDSGEDSDSSSDEAPIASRSTKSSTPFGKVSSPTIREVSISDMSSSIAISGTKTPPRESILLEAADLASQENFELKEQSFLVAEVAQALEEHMKRAKSAAASAARGKVGKGGRRASASTIGTMTPTLITDTMKYNALTYDDVVERDEDVTGIIDKVKLEDDVKMEDDDVAGTTTVVTDGDETEDDTTFSPATSVKSERKVITPFRSSTYKAIQAAKINRARAKSIDYTAVPVNDSTIVSIVGMKLTNGHYLNDDARERAIVARFCMSTAPKDPLLSNKVWHLLSQCKTLGAEFMRYLSALDPNSTLDLQRAGFGALSKSKLDDTLRDFSVFIINVLESILVDIKNGACPGFAKAETSAIRKAAEAWRLGTAKP